MPQSYIMAVSVVVFSSNFTAQLRINIKINIPRQQRKMAVQTLDCSCSYDSIDPSKATLLNYCDCYCFYVPVGISVKKLGKST